MLRLYDFRCTESNRVYERMVQHEVRMVECECGAPAKRMISPIRCKLDHTFPGEGMKWEKMHEREAKKGKDKG